MTRSWLMAVLVSGAWSTAAGAEEPRVQRFAEQTVVGKIPKPEIQILITRQNLMPPYQLTLEESFLPKVVAAVEQKPF
jgi:hypothetical protein